MQGEGGQGLHDGQALHEIGDACRGGGKAER